LDYFSFKKLDASVSILKKRLRTKSLCAALS
jgi:hypothetical protein